MSCPIRPLANADYAACYERWRRCSGLGDVPQADALKLFLAHNPGLSPAVESHGRVVGALLASFAGIRGYFYRLAVDPSNRRHGLARQLVAQAATALEYSGASRINLHAFQHKTEAAAFCLALGWQVTANLEPRQLFLGQASETVSAQRC